MNLLWVVLHDFPDITTLTSLSPTRPQAQDCCPFRILRGQVEALEGGSAFDMAASMEVQASQERKLVWQQLGLASEG